LVKKHADSMKLGSLQDHSQEEAQCSADPRLS